MTTYTDSDTELLTEHFGYAPVSLIDDIINSVNILAERALNSVEQGLLKAGPSALGFKVSKSQQQQQQQNDVATQLSPEERARNEIESGTHQLETLLCASIDRNFDKFEIYVLRNLFTVRPPELRDWMRLSHYEGLDFSSSSSSSSSSITRRSGDGDDAATDDATTTTTTTIRKTNSDAPTIDSVTALRRRLRESMRLNALLTAERARNETLLEDLRRLVGDPASSKGLAPQIKAESTSPAAAAAAGATSANTNTNTTNNTDSTTADNQNATTTAAAAAAAAADEEDQTMTDIAATTRREAVEGTEKDGKNNNNDYKSPFAFLHQKGDLASSVGGEAPLATTAAFTLSQMQSLRALSSSLRKLTPELSKPFHPLSASSAPGSDDGDDNNNNISGNNNNNGQAENENNNKKKKKSWRRERVEYVETATRRHLETVHGLEFGERGEVRDGEWQGPGRSLARGEVEGLERLVAILGGGEEVADGPDTAATATTAAPVRAENAEEERQDDDDGEEDRMDES